MASLEIQLVESGFIYIVTNGDVITRSRVWPDEEKAEQAGKDFKHFLETNEAVATGVDITTKRTDYTADATMIETPEGL